METRGLPLAPVVAFVLHQGPDRWTVSPCFEDLFALPEPLAGQLSPYLPKFRHLLLDLSQYDPAGEEKNLANRMLLEFMKQIRARQLLQFFLWLEKQEPHSPGNCCVSACSTCGMPSGTLTPQNSEIRFKPVI